MQFILNTAIQFLANFLAVSDVKFLYETHFASVRTHKNPKFKVSVSLLKVSNMCLQLLFWNLLF